MQQSGELSFIELIVNASFLVQLVMFFLLALSILSWTIIIQRSNLYKLGRQKADEFEERFWSGIDLNNLYQECIKRQQSLIGLEVIYTAGFKEFVRLVNSGPADQEVVMDGTYRQMKVASSREVESLETHLPTLATIGSISPYIGLFGTVWGIMHAFVALAAVKNATLSMVAPPIAEALIATAMGLFAAIPAVMFYNRFVTKVEALENRYLNFMDEFSTILNRRLVTIRTQMQKKEAEQEAAAKPVKEDPQEMYEKRARERSRQIREKEYEKEHEDETAPKYRIGPMNKNKQPAALSPAQPPTPAPEFEAPPSTVASEQGLDGAYGKYQVPVDVQEAVAPAPVEAAMKKQYRTRSKDGRQGYVNIDEIKTYQADVKPAPIGEQLSKAFSARRIGASARRAQSADDEPHYITPGVEGDRERQSQRKGK